MQVGKKFYEVQLSYTLRESKYCFSNNFKVRLLLLAFVIGMAIACIPSSVPAAFAVSPSFGHKEFKDQPSDLVDQKKIQGLSNSCDSQRNWNQSIDIFAADYFSDSKILNVTLWLGSIIKNASFEYQDIPSYGIFIDADSNDETGWQGIDYQMEVVRNNGTWNNTLYQFPLYGEPFRIIKQINQTTEDLYKIGNKYVLMTLDLTAVSSPDKYKVMFYAEDRRRDNCIWKTDFTSWINVPNPDLILDTTGPIESTGPIELRPDDKEVIGVQLISNADFTPEVSNYKINDNNLSGIQSKVLSKNRTNIEPINIEIKIPSNISSGKYVIPIQANVTQISGTPNTPIFNFGYTLEEANLPIAVLRPFTPQEIVINFWRDWGSPIAFIIGVITGKLGTVLWEALKNLFKKSRMVNR